MEPTVRSKCFIHGLWMKVFVSTIIFFFTCCVHLRSQSTSIESLTIADGLSQGMIFDIEQTQDGFMWFATKDGLNRYDGYTFKVFTNDPFNPYTIAGNEVIALFEDSRGNLWIALQGRGFDVMEKNTGRFLHLPVNMYADEQGRLNVNDFVEGPDSMIWIGTENGLLSAQWTIGSHSNATSPDLRASASVKIETIGDEFQTGGMYNLTLSEDKTHLLFIRLDGVYHYNPLTKVSTLVRAEDTFNRSGKIPQGKTARVWTSFMKDDQCLMIFDNGTIRDFMITEKSPYAFISMATDGNGNLIWTSRKGNETYVYSLPEKEIMREGALNNPKLICKLEEQSASLEMDDAGNLWVGMSGYGLRKIRLNHQPFHHYLKGNSVRRIMASDSMYLWLSGTQVVWQLDEKENIAKPVHDMPKNVVQYLQTRNGGAYAITTDYLHYYVSDVNAPFPPPKVIDFPIHEYTCIIEGPNQDIWAGGINAMLMRYDVASGMYSFFDFSKQLGKVAAVFTLHIDKEGNLWAGTTHGVAQIRIADMTFGPGNTVLEDDVVKYYQTDAQNPASLRYNFVTSFSDDPHFPDKYIWIGTKGGGLNLLHKTTGSIRHVHSYNSGLPNDVVYTMLPDDLGHIWLSTNRGLSRLTCLPSLYESISRETDLSGTTFRRDLIFHNFRQTDGLQSDEFNTSVSYRRSDGLLIFGGVNGLTAFYPGEIHDRTSNASVRITGLKVNNLDVNYFEKGSPLDKPTHLASEVVLTHKQNLVTLDFALMNFVAPNENQFRYRLHGVDPAWVDAGVVHSANYAQLRPGKYTFEVQGNIGYGEWSPPTFLQIIVRPPWWATSWAFGVYFLVIVATVYAIIYFFKKRIRLQHQLKLKDEEASKLKELDTFKSRLFTNLTHEFRTPLTVILGMTNQLDKSSWQNGIAEKERGKVSSALKLIENNGKNLLHLINQLLDLSKLENNSFQLHVRQDDIVPYLRYVTESFQSYANGNNLSLRFVTSMDSLVMDYDAEQIKQVLTNLISNALKFTPSGGDIVVRLARNESTLEIIVKDTGIGISSTDLPNIFDRFYQADNSSTRIGKGTGIGLAHANELVRIMGGQIMVESAPGKGTSMIVEIPVTNQAVRVHQFGYESGNVEPASIPGIPLNGFDVHPADEEMEAAGTTGLPHLLIIEDNPDVVIYLRTCLEKEYQIFVAFNGEIGIEKAFEEIPDFIISDVMMPVKDGYEVCDALKNDERTSHIPIILLTAKADAASRLTGLRRGADAYLAKPFHEEELLLQISTLLENRRRMASYFSKALVPGPHQPIADEALTEVMEIEDAFITKVKSVIEAFYSEENFGLPQLCLELGMSRSQLFRKMKAVTNTSPSDLIRSYRLVKAKTLLETGEFTIAETTYRVGFKDPSYFSKIFQEEFGVLPSNISK